MEHRTTAANSSLGTKPPVAAPTLELECDACGYSVVVRHAPPVCPMCSRRAWVPIAWRPFTRPPSAA